MRTNLAGWKIDHLTERTVKLVKPDWAWRRYTGQDGIVLIRGEPGIDRGLLIDRAYQAAEHADAELSQKLARDLLPNGRQWVAWKEKSRQMAKVFGTGEEPDAVGRKGA